MKYRPEIDGLRAIAVSSVIFYHADIAFRGISFFTGGFIGVDIFFVISGFLITSILLKEMDKGEFSLTNFYERRARRILPALFFVLLATIPFAFLWMLPKAFNEYTIGVLTSVGFSSNIYFWLHDSYTAVTNAFNPLLHTWSLAVEEQFYLLFPLALLAMWRLNPKRIGVFLASVLIVSLALAETTNVKYADAAFYLLPTRAWELMAGAILAWTEFKGVFRPKAISQKTMPTVGMCLIASAVLFYTDTMPHPGFFTAIPVLGTLMIIRYAHEREWITWILSWRICVFVGLISYSFYLWHQPVFAFARIHSTIPVTDVEKIGLIAISFALAVFSWWFIERPFRNKAKISTRKIWTSSAAFAGILVLLCAAQTMFLIKERYVRISPYAAEAADLKYTEYLYKNAPCHGSGVPFCVRGAQDPEERWIALGDSHMDRVAPVLWDALKSGSASFTTMISGGCGYVADMEVILDGKPDVCTPQINAEREKYLLSLPPSKIVILGRYTLYLEGTWFDNGEGGIEDTGAMYMQPAGRSDLSREQRIIEVQAGIRHSVEKLLKAGHEVILVYPVPEMGWDIPQKFNKRALKVGEEAAEDWIQKGGVAVSHDVFVKRNRHTYEAFDAIQHPELTRVYPEKLFCNSILTDKCVSAANGKILYSDDDHLSKAGARMLVNEIISAVTVE